MVYALGLSLAYNEFAPALGEGETTEVTEEAWRKERDRSPAGPFFG